MIISWLVSALLAFLGGVFLLAYWVALPNRMSLYLVLLVVVLLAWGLVTWQAIPKKKLVGAAGLLVVMFLSGYLISTRVYLSRSEPGDLPEVTRSIQDPGDGHTAILYYTHGEPPAYSPWPWIETFHELDADKASFIPWPFRPYFLSRVRQFYLESGGSAHNKVHQIMLHSLIQAMPEALGQGVRFYQAFLDSPPRPDEATIQAINEGASKLIVVPVFLTDSSHTIGGREQVESVEAEKYGVDICFAKPLWDTESLQQMFVARADAHLNGVEKSKVGILLVGHGQPEDWDAIYPTQTEQENLFRQQVRERLIQAGYEADQIVLAWMEFKQPDVVEGVKELLAQDVEMILYFSASISADAIHSDIQVPKEVAHAGAPPQVKLVNMGAWGNSPYVIEAIRQRILECDPALAGDNTAAK
jgi:sirohydrochlorin ferrochelatase